MCNIVPVERKRLLTLSLLKMDVCNEYPHNFFYSLHEYQQLRGTLVGFFLVCTAGSSIRYLAIVLSFMMRAGLSDSLLFGL